MDHKSIFIILDETIDDDASIPASASSSDAASSVINAPASIIGGRGSNLSSLPASSAVAETIQESEDEVILGMRLNEEYRSSQGSLRHSWLRFSRNSSDVATSFRAKSLKEQVTLVREARRISALQQSADEARRASDLRIVNNDEDFAASLVLDVIDGTIIVHQGARSWRHFINAFIIT